MKKYIQYIMILISLFMTVFQSLHILEHSSNNEDIELEEGFSNIHDTCNICHYNQQFVDNDITIEIEDEIQTFIQKDKILFSKQVKQPVLLTHKSLRAPPYII